MSQLTAKLKPIKLFSFQSPDFGIAGMRVMPAEMAFHPKHNAIFIGFHTNLPGLESAGGLTALTALDFAQNENLAVALQPAILKSAISLLMQDGKIPRRYTTDGKASESGPAHVTLNTVRIVEARGGKGQSGADTSGSAGSENQDLDVGFRAWNLLGAACFWFDALVTGDVTLKDSKLAVNLNEVKIIKSSAPALIEHPGQEPRQLEVRRVHRQDSTAAQHHAVQAQHHHPRYGQRPALALKPRKGQHHPGPSQRRAPQSAGQQVTPLDASYQRPPLHQQRRAF